MENVFKEIELKKLEMESKMQNIRKKEYEIQIFQQQLKKREVELDEKNRDLIHKEIQFQTISAKKGKADNIMSADQEHFVSREGYTNRMNDFMDTKHYGIKSEHENSLHYPSYHTRNQPQRSPRYFENANNLRTSSKSGDKNRKFQNSFSMGRNYKANFKGSAASPILINGSGISKHSYNKSKSNADSTRLHDLGNKL